MSEKKVIHAIDCGRHDYWKVPIETLCDWNIVECISGYSFIGNGNEPLNEKGFAYLEIDVDCGIFDKASNFYNESWVIEDITEQFDEKYDDYREWLEELTPWDTDVLDDQGYMWDCCPEALIDKLNEGNEPVCDGCGEYESECLCGDDEEEEEEEE